MFKKIQNPFKFHILSILKIMIQLCELEQKHEWRESAWGNLTGKFTAISTTSLKTYIYLHSFTPVHSPEYAPLNHHIHLSKHFFWMSNTITLIFLFLNQLYKYRRLEKFTVHRHLNLLSHFTMRACQLTLKRCFNALCLTI